MFNSISFSQPGDEKQFLAELRSRLDRPGKKGDGKQTLVFVDGSRSRSLRLSNLEKARLREIAGRLKTTIAKALSA